MKIVIGPLGPLLRRYTENASLISYRLIVILVILENKHILIPKYCTLSLTVSIIIDKKKKKQAQIYMYMYINGFNILQD